MGKFKLQSPTVIGHESCGIIEKLGDCVKCFCPGDRVCIEPGVACLRCTTCKTGVYNLCPNMRFAGLSPDDGMMCRYKCHPAIFCHKIPETIPCELGPLIEPLAAGIHTTERGEINYRDAVLILGASMFALCAIQAARARGATNICCVDTMDYRLKLAHEVGASSTLNISCVKGSICEEICERLGGAATKTIDCKVSDASIQIAIEVTKPNGIIVLSGFNCPEVKIPILNATMNEITIRGAFRYRNDFPAAVALMECVKCRMKPLVTHKYQMTRCVEALETAKKGGDGTLKVLVNCESPESAPKEGWAN